MGKYEIISDWEVTDNGKMEVVIYTEDGQDTPIISRQDWINNALGIGCGIYVTESGQVDFDKTILHPPIV